MQNNKSSIQDKVFKDFEKSLDTFYIEKRQKYFLEFQSKIKPIVDDMDDVLCHKVIHKEAKKFIESQNSELILFIRNYVDKCIDEIKTLLDSNIIDKEEANIRFEVLKYILLEGESKQEKC